MFVCRSPTNTWWRNISLLRTWPSSRSSSTGSGLSSTPAEDPAGLWDPLRTRPEECDAQTGTDSLWEPERHMNLFVYSKIKTLCLRCCVSPSDPTPRGSNTCSLERREEDEPSSASTTGSSCTCRRSSDTSTTKATASTQSRPRYKGWDAAWAHSENKCVTVQPLLRPLFSLLLIVVHTLMRNFTSCHLFALSPLTQHIGEFHLRLQSKLWLRNNLHSLV